MDGVAAWLVAKELLEAHDSNEQALRERDVIIREAGGCTFPMPAVPVFSVVNGVSNLPGDWFEKVVPTECETGQGLIRHEIVCRGVDFHKQAKSVNAAMSKWVTSSREHESRAQVLAAELELVKAQRVLTVGGVWSYIKCMIWG